VRSLRLLTALLALLVVATACTGDAGSDAGDDVLASGAGSARAGRLEVQLTGSRAEVTVAAPVLTEQQYGGLRAWLDGGLMAGAPVEITAEDGAAAQGVLLTREYAVPLPADAAATLAYFDDDRGDWVAVPTEIAADRRSITARVGHLSLWDDFVSATDDARAAFGQGLRQAGQAAQDITEKVYETAQGFNAAVKQTFADAGDALYYGVGKAIDVRVDPPSCDGDPPAWVDDTVVIAEHRNNPVLWCVGHDAQAPELLVVKARVNRGFAMFAHTAAPAAWRWNSTFDQDAFDAALAAVTDLDGTLAESVATLFGSGMIVGAGQEIGFGFAEDQVRRLPIGQPLVSLDVPEPVAFLATAAAQLLVQHEVGVAEGMLTTVIAVASCGADVLGVTDLATAARAVATCFQSADEAIARRVGVALLERGMDPQLAGQKAGRLVGKISIGLALVGPLFNAFNYVAERGIDPAARRLTVYLHRSPGSGPDVSGPPTQVITLDPFTTGGALAAGYTVDDHTAEPAVDCSYDDGSPSALTGGTHACGATADGTHSCWAPPSSPGRLLCLYDPWTTVLVSRRAENLSATGRPAAPQPLGLELADGSRWLLRHGGSWGGRADGLVGAYSCSSGACGGTGDEPLVVLVEPEAAPVDGSGPVWTVRVGQLGDPATDYPPPTRRAVTKAWFIASSFR
jgi:hypothetical protein